MQCGGVLSVYHCLRMSHKKNARLNPSNTQKRIYCRCFREIDHFLRVRISAYLAYFEDIFLSFTQLGLRVLPLLDISS